MTNWHEVDGLCHDCEEPIGLVDVGDINGQAQMVWRDFEVRELVWKYGSRVVVYHTECVPKVLPTSVADEARSRMGDPSTSAIAAASVDRAHSTVVKHEILEVLIASLEPMTDEQIVAEVQRRIAPRTTTPQRVRTLRKELVDEDERVVAHDREGVTERGRPCTRWRPVWPG